MDQSTSTSFDSRELSELAFALVYALYFRHGTAGHNRLMLLAWLANRMGIILSPVTIQITLSDGTTHQFTTREIE